MNEQTRYARERSHDARRPLKPVTAKLAEWAQGSSNIFVNQAWRLVGTLADAIRSGQYDLGMPFTYSKSIELTPGETNVLVLNVKKFGVIQHMTPVVSNITEPTSDQDINAGITRIQIGAQTFWEAQDGTLIRPAQVMASGFIPNIQGVRSPSDTLGYLRRIPVAQGDVIECDVRNFSAADNYQVSLVVTQYGMMPPALVNQG